jgi:hypothetical protein
MKRKPSYLNSVLPLLLLLAPAAVAAEPVELHCKGVNYTYDSGIGTGPAKREASQRTITIDQEEMRAELADGEQMIPVTLTMKYGDYQGFFPNNRLVFNTPVLGEEIEIGSDLEYLEIRFLLESDKKFLSFFGTCAH